MAIGHLWRWVALIAFVIIADQLTKWMILEMPALNALACLDGTIRCGRIEISSVFDLSMLWNRGISFGTLQSDGLMRWVLVLVTSGIAIGFAYWLTRAERWLTAPEIYLAAPVPILTGLIALALLRALSVERHSKPFWLSLALFFFGMAGLGVTIWPYVIPPDVTIWDAAAPERSQIFMLVGVAITMPLILAYTAWAYYVFRGKVGHEGYH